jgi:hypothetical protein
VFPLAMTESLEYRRTGRQTSSPRGRAPAVRAAFIAEAQHDPLVLAASLFRMAHVFLTLGQLALVGGCGELAL